MLNLNEVKTALENNKDIDQFLIFYYEDTTDYIPVQYAKALARIRNSEILYVNELDEIGTYFEISYINSALSIYFFN